MFQHWFTELISLISDILVGASAVTVAIIAVSGITQWRKELSGRTKFEIARKMVVLAFEFRDKYKMARHPFTFAGELVERNFDENENEEKNYLQNEFSIRFKRLEPLQEVLRRLYETSWEAEVFLGNDIGIFIDPLEKAFGDLYTSVNVYFESRIQLREKGKEALDDWLEDHYKRIYGYDAEIENPKIDKAVQNLVDKLKRYVQ